MVVEQTGSHAVRPLLVALLAPSAPANGGHANPCPPEIRSRLPHHTTVVYLLRGSPRDVRMPAGAGNKTPPQKHDQVGTRDYECNKRRRIRDSYSATTARADSADKRASYSEHRLQSHRKKRSRV